MCVSLNDIPPLNPFSSDVSRMIRAYTFTVKVEFGVQIRSLSPFSMAYWYIFYVVRDRDSQGPSLPLYAPNNCSGLTLFSNVEGETPS